MKSPTVKSKSSKPLWTLVRSTTVTITKPNENITVTVYYKNVDKPEKLGEFKSVSVDPTARQLVGQAGLKIYRGVEKVVVKSSLSETTSIPEKDDTIHILVLD